MGKEQHSYRKVNDDTSHLGGRCLLFHHFWLCSNYKVARKQMKKRKDPSREEKKYESFLSPRRKLCRGDKNTVAAAFFIFYYF
jgi:hypothetical protein